MVVNQEDISTAIKSTPKTVLAHGLCFFSAWPSDVSKRFQVGGATTSDAAAPEPSSGVGGGAENDNSSSSGEEEWRDDGMDFSKRDSSINNTAKGKARGGGSTSTSNRPIARADGRRHKADSKAATRVAAAPAARGTRRSARDKSRAAAAAAAAAPANDWPRESSGGERVEGPAAGGGGRDMDELEDEDVVERGPTPPPLLSPAGVSTVKFSMKR